MPYDFEIRRIHLPREKDRRVKLTAAQRQEILVSTQSVHALAREYEVSRRTINFIKHPERQARNLKLRKKRGGWRQYYDRDKHKISIRNHQRYKQWVTTERKGGIPAFALAKMFVKCLGIEPFRRVTLDVWSEYNAPWASEKMLDAVWKLIGKAQESVCSTH